MNPKALVKHLLPRPVLRACYQLQARARASRETSNEYHVVTDAQHGLDDCNGWHLDQVAQRQEDGWRELVRQMYAGQPRQDLAAAAQALRATGRLNPSVLEVGCGSGYYSEILPHLLGAPIQYTGLDYSAPMIELARKNYPDTPFHVGDATQLPFDDAAFDIVLNGGALMHIPDYRAAIRESVRVARHWCLFHTVPVLQRRATTLVRKNAYGAPTAEVVFNHADLLAMLADAGLTTVAELPSVEYNLAAVLGEPTRCVTLVCRREALAPAQSAA